MQVKINTFLIQVTAAEDFMGTWHERLLKEGFTYDGMDGYIAPEGYDLAKFLKLTTEEKL